MSILKVLPTALAAALIATAGAAFAGGNLTPGTTIIPTDVGAVYSPALWVTSPAISPFTSPLGAKNPYSGSLFTFVENEGAANPLGGLTFLYGIANDGTSSIPLALLAANGYTGFDTSAYYDSMNGGSVAPSSAHRTLNGDTIKFSYLDAGGNEAILPGSFTFLAVVRTNAPSFTNVLNGITDGTETNALSYAPALVPEASTTVSFALLLVFGLGSVAVRAHRRSSVR